MNTTQINTEADAIEADAIATLDSIGTDTIERLAIEDVDYVAYDCIRVAIDFKIGNTLQGRITLELNDTFSVIVGSAKAGWYGDQPRLTNVHAAELANALTSLVANQGVTA